MSGGFVQKQKRKQMDGERRRTEQGGNMKDWVPGILVFLGVFIVPVVAYAITNSEIVGSIVLVVYLIWVAFKFVGDDDLDAHGPV